MNFDLVHLPVERSARRRSSGRLITIVLTVVSFAFGLAIGLVVALARDNRFRVGAGRGVGLRLDLPGGADAGAAAVRLERAAPDHPGAQGHLVHAVHGRDAGALDERGRLRRGDRARRPARHRRWPEAGGAGARSLARVRTFRRVIAPQLVRVIIPPISNDFITLLKITWLAYIISLRELLNNAQLAIASTFRFAEWYAAVAVYFLVIVSIFMVIQSQIEKRFVWTSRAPAGPAGVRGGDGDDAMTDDHRHLPVGHLLDAELLHEPVAADEPAVSEYILEAAGPQAVRPDGGAARGVAAASTAATSRPCSVRRARARARCSAASRCWSRSTPARCGWRAQRVGSREGRGGRTEALSERELARQRSEIGMVFQRFNLFPHLTALGNVMIGLTEVRGRAGRRPPRSRRRCSGGSASASAPASTRPSCRAASSSAWPSRGRWS